MARDDPGERRSPAQPGTPTVAASGIVLAGGRSTRFRGDKLATTVQGRALLSLAVEAASAVCDEVVVAVAAGSRPTVALPARALIVSDPKPDGGPLVGLLAGAVAARHDQLLLIGGDMPSLVPSVLRLLLDTLGASREAAALGLGPEDTAQPLPLALRRGAVLAALEASGDPGGRSIRWLLGRLDTVVVPEAEWRDLDPEATTLRDVDRPEDLPAALPGGWS